MLKKIILSTTRKIKELVQTGRPRPNMKKQKTKDAERSTAFTEVDAPVVEEAAADRKKRPRTRRKQGWTLDKFQVPEVEGKSRFHDFDIPVKVMRAIADQKFKYCTPIQEKSLAAVLSGKDLVGKANTGTGKTAVFLVAILARLLQQNLERQKSVHALILAPTRELVAQITKDANQLARYTDISVNPVYGGVDYQKQMELVEKESSSIIVATPGRLLDFLGKGIVNLSRCSILVLDEADRMLDMGFIPDVRRIVGRLPNRRERQTMLFSATVPVDVQRLASQWCVEPQVVEAEEEQVAVQTVEQIIYLTTTEEKYSVLYNLLRKYPEERVIIFANMKNEAKRLADRLKRNGIDCVLLSGDVAQNKRMSRLENFRSGRVKVLVATDVAGRGIHIEGITFVVNYTLPFEPEDYVHRIGRTGRAGASGKAISFACEEGAFYLPAIEEFVGHKLECSVPEEGLLKKPPRREVVETDAADSDGSTGKRSPRRRRPRRRSNRGA
jgi:ATP-dependent RNA helicase RhlB